MSLNVPNIYLIKQVDAYVNKQKYINTWVVENIPTVIYQVNICINLFKQNE